MLQDDEISNADSERRDPNFWQRVDVAYKNSETPDIFFNDEAKNEEIFTGLRAILQREYVKKEDDKPDAKQNTSSHRDQIAKSITYTDAFIKLLQKWIS